MKTGERFPLEQKAEIEVDRRRFLVAAVCAGALVAGGEWLGLRVAGDEGFEVALPPNDTPAAGECRVVTAEDGREAWVVGTAAGVVAFDRRCPHLGCPVLWSAERGRFECPCHHAAFDALNGAVLSGPPRRGLVPVRIRNA